MAHHHETLTEVQAEARELRDLVPDVFGAYAQLSRASMAEGTLSTKVKELIALTIAVTRECDGCIASHARSAVRAGLTRQEIAESMGVAILLNGGPGTVWGPRALAAFDEFSALASSPT